MKEPISFIKKYAPDWNDCEIVTKLNKIYKITLKNNNCFYKFYMDQYGLSNVSVNSKYTKYTNQKMSFHKVNNSKNSKYHKVSKIGNYFNDKQKSFDTISDFNWHKVR